MKLSIAIPTYEIKGKGKFFLKNLLNSLQFQTFKDFNVIISDQSNNNCINEVCSQFKNNLDIRIFKLKTKIQNCSSNFNNAIEHCDGDFIKLLCQDDYFFNNNSLQILTNSLNDNIKWLANSSIYVKNNKEIVARRNPIFNTEIHLGNNTLGEPTAITIKNLSKLPKFDTDLNWLLDVDFYKKMFMEYGEPFLLNEIITVINFHEDQLTHSISDEQKNKEFLINMKKIY